MLLVIFVDDQRSVAPFFLPAKHQHSIMDSPPPVITPVTISTGDMPTPSTLLKDLNINHEENCPGYILHCIHFEEFFCLCLWMCARIYVYTQVAYSGCTPPRNASSINASSRHNHLPWRKLLWVYIPWKHQSWTHFHFYVFVLFLYINCNKFISIHFIYLLFTVFSVLFCHASENDQLKVLYISGIE